MRWVVNRRPQSHIPRNITRFVGCVNFQRKTPGSLKLAWLMTLMTWPMSIRPIVVGERNRCSRLQPRSCEAWENLDTMTVESDCVNDHPGLMSIGYGCVNISISRHGTLSCDSAQITKALRVSSHSGRSIVGCAGAFPVHTPSRPNPAGLDAVCPCGTINNPHESGRNTRGTRHAFDYIAPA